MLASLVQYAVEREALQDEPRSLAIRLTQIRIEGFKVYSSPTDVGPLHPFTCIIGPNGIGKSVLGEAVAFALGASARMLRVKTLAGVISTSLDKHGQPLPTAQVILAFDILDPLECRVVGRLHVRRQVNSSSRSTYHIAVAQRQHTLGQTAAASKSPVIPPLGKAPNASTPDADNIASELVIEDAIEDNTSDEEFLQTNNKDSDDDDDEDNQDAFIPKDLIWSDISQRDLARILSNCGLDINALDRVIVTQHRRAVEVADPKKLVLFIEQLIGGGGAQKELEALTAQWMAADAEERRLDEEYDTLISKSEELNPALQQWKRFNENNLEYQERLATVYRKKAVLLEKEANAAAEEAETAEISLKTLEDAQEAARITADELLVVKEEADGVAAEAAAEHSTSATQHNTALENLERAQARKRAANAQSKRAVTTLSSAVAAVSAEEYTLENTKNKAEGKRGAAKAAAGKIKEQLEKKAEELENQVAALQQELETIGEEIEEKIVEESNDGVISGKVLAAREAWKQAREKATAAAEAAETAAEQSSQAKLTDLNATSGLKSRKKAEHDAHKAVERSNSSMLSLEKCLLALEKEEMEAHRSAEAAENELTTHHIEAMKLEKALQKTTKALKDANIDDGDSYYQPRNDKNAHASGRFETSRQSVDAAVVALAQQAQHDELNPLTGAFHGRIHSVLRVLIPEAINAANAVLLEKCNPASALVTSTRTAAEAVVDYFKENKVGIASCTVLEELRGKNGDDNSTNNNNEAAASKMLAPVLDKTPGAICPLSSLIQNNTNIAGSSLLSSDLFNSWYLVSDPMAASKLIEQERKEAAAGGGGGGGGSAGSKSSTKKNQQKKQTILPLQRRNLVTLCGSLFKCDGEICAPNEEALLRFKIKYLLGSEFVDNGSPGSLLNPSLKSDEVKEYERIVEKLRAEYASAVSAVEELECATDAVNERTSAAHAVLASKQAATAATRSKIEALLKAMQKETKALHFAQAAAEKASQNHIAAAAKAKKFQTAYLESEAFAKQCFKKSERLHQIYAHAAQDEPEAQKALEVERAVADLRSQCDQAEKRKCTLQNELASLQESVQRLTKAMVALHAAEEAAIECANNVSEATLAVATAEEKLEQALNAKEKVATAKKIATDNWREAVVHHQVALQAHQQTLATLQNARTRQQSALSKAVAISKESQEAMQQVNAINAQLNSAGVALKGVLSSKVEEESIKNSVAAEADDDGTYPISSEHEYCSSSSSNDVENEQIAAKRRRGGTIAAVRGGGGVGHELRQTAAYAEKNQKGNSSSDEALSIEPMETSSDSSESEWEEDKVTHALAGLATQKSALEYLAVDLDIAAATEAMHVYSQLVQLKATLQEQDNKVQKLSIQLAEARTARYIRFSTAMDAAAVHLSKIYQRLTGNIGDAACLYPKDENSVFKEGVTFKVRPDNGHWRTFSSLSGGQQALAALSLCFALQKVAPCPFYFFDEIDAALDTINSQRVAEFLRDLCESEYTLEDGMAPQIIAVSHRTAPQEAAHCLLAVYPINSTDTDIYNKCATTTVTPSNSGGESIYTGIMTLYPTSYPNGDIFNCQETGKMRFVRLDDGGRVHAVEGGEEEFEGDEVDLEFVQQMSQMLQNMEMQRARDGDGEG